MIYAGNKTIQADTAKYERSMDYFYKKHLIKKLLKTQKLQM